MVYYTVSSMIRLLNLILHYYLVESYSNKFGALTITGTEAFVKPQKTLEWVKLWYHKGELYFNSYIYILYIYESWVNIYTT